MQYINTSYGIYFNRKYKRSGHFLQGRFQAIIVEHGQELKYVTAYIHLNPARAEKGGKRRKEIAAIRREYV